MITAVLFTRNLYKKIIIKKINIDFRRQLQYGTVYAANEVRIFNKTFEQIIEQIILTSLIDEFK